VLDVHEVSAQVARVLGHAGYIGVDLTHARSSDGVRGGDSLLVLRSQSYTTIGGVLSLDTYDRVFAPTTGTSALMVWNGDLGHGRSFGRRFADLQGALPVGSHVSLLGRVDVGYASGSTLPLHDRFFLGGSVPSSVWPSQFVPFLGIDAQSAEGTVVHVAQAGIQAEVRDNVFVSLRGNVGNVFDTWPAPVGWRSYLRGGGLTIGTMLAPGPVSITFGSRSLHQRPVIEINFGATF
jgi:NTE family protein